MAHSQATKDELRIAYIYKGLSLAMAAVMSEVSYPTAQRWKNVAASTGDDWDKVKTAHSMAGGGDNEAVARQILTDFVIQYKTTMEMLRSDPDMSPQNRVELLASLADAYTKTVAANRKMLPETSKLAVAFELLEMLANYLRQHKPELLAQFGDVLEPFGREIEKKLK